MLNRPNTGTAQSRVVYRIVRLLYLAGVIALLHVGITTESTPLIALGGVLFIGFLPTSRWLGARLGIEDNDERVRMLVRAAASRALIGLFAVGFLAYVLGATVEAQEVGLGEPLATVLRQGEIVFVWVGMAAIISSVVHKGWNLVRARRLEG